MIRGRYIGGGREEEVRKRGEASKDLVRVRKCCANFTLRKRNSRFR
jgi:hypothetical protein